MLIIQKVILEYRDVFKKNGFEFRLDSEGTPGQRLSLTSVPICHKRTLGSDEIFEMIGLLQDSSTSGSQSVRPSRISAMLASKSCRSAVMIGENFTGAYIFGIILKNLIFCIFFSFGMIVICTGDALDQSRRERIVHTLSLLDNPWSCPHGRPTMRHLVDLERVSEEGKR